MNWLESSEVVAGLCITGKLNPEFVRSPTLAPPYAEMVSKLAQGENLTGLLDSIGLQPVTTAREAAGSVNPDDDWIAILERAYHREEQSRILERNLKHLKNGEDVNAEEILTLVDESWEKSNYVTADTLTGAPVIWRNTFYDPIDFHVGNPMDSTQSGTPEAGLTIIAGPPATGKSSLLAKLQNNRLKAGKKCLMYSLEMTSEQYIARIKNCGDLTQAQLRNLIICERVMTADEIYTEGVRIASLEGVDCIGVDFADLIVSGKEDEPSVALAYKQMANLAKRTKIPVFLLGQLSRAYTGGIPRVNNIRWSGLAEALASLVLLIYNPNTIYANMGSSNDLPLASGRGYLIVGKSRFGYREGGPGAIQIDFDGKTGWGDVSRGWFPLKSV